MNEPSPVAHIGQIVRVRKGREFGQYAIITKILDERFVYIADGEKRKFDRPKRKNINHLEFFNDVSPEVQNSIKETGRVTNGKIRYAITKFVNEQVTDFEKGEQLDGERRCN